MTNASAREPGDAAMPADPCPPAPASTSARHAVVFSCFVDHSGHDTAEVHLRGELDIATAPQLTETLRAALVSAGLVMVNLSQLTFMDCTGLATIIAASSHARQNRRRLVLVRAVGQVDRLLDLTRASTRLEIADRGATESRGAKDGSPSTA